MDKPQIGWVARDFEMRVGRRERLGVGDDAHSWAIDGQRQQMWHGGGTDVAESVIALTVTM